MNIFLPPAPKHFASEVEREQWLETLWRFVRPAPSTSGDLDFQIPSSSSYHGVTALSAGRALTLPASDQVADGSTLIVQDESGAAGAHTVTLNASSGDTVHGLTTITSNYGRRTALKRGKVWFLA